MNPGIMQIQDVRLYLVKHSDASSTDWRTEAKVANPMSDFEAYSAQRASWMGPGQDPFAVEITAADGTTGVALNSAGGPLACEVVDGHFRRFIEGANAFDRERIWEQMYRSTLPYGQRGVTMIALSAVDLALWDLAGKLTDQPVYNLLGGKVRLDVPCYLTAHESILDRVADEPFFGLKLAAPYGPADGYADGLNETEAMVAAARDAIGDEKELMLDCYMAWDREFTVRAADRLREYDIKWFEDALHPECVDRYGDIRSQVKPIQIAAGNMEFGHKAFHQLLRNDAADILQPDLRWAGGLTEVQRIAEMAKPYGVPVVPHAPSTYSYHFAIANANAPYAEFLGVFKNGRLQAPDDPVIGEPEPVDGAVEPDDAPGFGIELATDRLRRYDG
jgi:L-alanine-DL-glutamate epimerase-like enolase superfamily enzyme